MTREGVSMEVDLTEEEIARIDALAEALGVTREEQIAEVIRIGLRALVTAPSARPGTPS